MHRIDTANAVTDLFGAGKNGFGSGNPATNTPATYLDAEFFNMLQEELAAVPEAAGIALNKALRNQLLTAIQALIDQLSFGRASTWVNTISSRSLAVTYYNTTSKPIMVNVECQNFSAGNTLYAVIGTGQVGGTTTPTSGGICSLVFVVPPGLGYTVYQATAGTPVSRWTELR